VYYGNNPFRQLNDLPDQPRIGVILMLCGICVGVVRWTWPRLGSHSFQRVSAGFMRVEPYLPKWHRYPIYPSEMQDFGDMLIVMAFLLLFCGAFIFLRRGFWWVAENRSEHEITEIKFK
jgi:hypothetical protein